MKKINFGRINLRSFFTLPAHERKVTLSTLITLIRIFLTPIIVVAMMYQYWGIAFILFVTAVVTDSVDGYVARLRNERTFLGASLDAIADKLLILACFFTLAFVKTPLFVLPQGFVLFVLTKEIAQLAGAAFLYIKNGYLDVRPTLIGKMTMVVQSGFIIWLFACYFFQWLPIKTYYTMLGLVILLVSVSLLQYMRIGLKIFFKHSHQKENHL